MYISDKLFQHFFRMKVYPRLHKCRNGRGCQQKERRAKHNRAIKCIEFCLIRIGPRIEPHQQERNYEIL